MPLTFKASLLLSGVSEAIARLFVGVVAAPVEDGSNKARLGAQKLRPHVMSGGEHALGLGTPRHNGTPLLRALTEDEPEEDVEAAEGEEEERGDEREVVDVV